MQFVLLFEIGGLLLFGCLLILLEVGRRLGSRHRRANPDNSSSAFGAVEAAIFGILGLLLAFTFSGAISRLDERRLMIVEEANKISATFLLTDILPASARPGFRALLKDYLQARVEATRLAVRVSGGQEWLNSEAVSRSDLLQVQLWQMVSKVNDAARSDSIEQVLMPSMNSMFAEARRRNAVAHRHPPLTVYIMLVAMVMISSVVAGYGMSAAAARSWLHVVAFAATLAITVMIIWDIEFPRQGFIRIDRFDATLADVLNKSSADR